MTQEDFERAIKVLQKHNQDLIAEIQMLKKEMCDKCKYFDGNSCQHYDYKVGYTHGYEDASKNFRQEPCDDAVSRQAILDKLNEWEWQELYLPIHFKENIIDELPSVRPQEQTGHWIKSKDGYMRCDQCGSRGSAIKARFCHHCGARMVEPQESEEGGEQW